jgi:NAD(P)-dependent dehydrogenase (short-subunit alcohol dehydrogenase family)
MAGQQFSGKVALVTGGSSGIGRATALAFAREGAKVAIADVNATGGAETVRMIQAAGGEALFVQTDVSKAAEVDAAISNTMATYGRLDCAFNNAGIGKRMPLTELTEADFDHALSINRKGVWLCMKYEIPHMVQQGGGTIVNTASVWGVVAPHRAAYVASKYGVVGLTKAAALEFAPAGLRVNAVCPGMIRTPMVEGSLQRDPQFEQLRISQHPIGRLGLPAEIAEAVLWLCSDSASFVTGHAMVVDGGFSV